MICKLCGSEFVPVHFNQKLCGEQCRIACVRDRRLRYKGSPKGAASEARWRKNPIKKETDRRYYTSARGRAKAVARVQRLLEHDPYYRLRKRLCDTASYRRLRRMLIELHGCCQKCGARERLTIDHIKPMSLGGKHEWSNVQLLCVSCNSAKRQETIRYALP